MSEDRAPLRAGRYRLHGEIASGGMATVHFGQLVGAHGFSRVVAIKRMLPRLARDPRFHAMFVDEAKLASRVQHPNVVSILDVVDEDGELMIVMDYVRGPALSTLLGRARDGGEKIPVPVLANIGCALLAGLHAAHEARDRRGRPLGIVHRDVSPQNVLVGMDGVTRIMDFGIAKATELLGDEDRELTGKVSYMAPEQFLGTGVDRRADIFAAAVVLWSALASRRLFRSTEVRATIDEVLRCEIPPLGDFRDDVDPRLEAALRRALNPDRAQRYESAEAFAGAIEAATPLGSTRAVADWVKSLAGPIVAEREQIVVHIEKTRTTMAISLPAAPDGSTREATGTDLSNMLTPEWVPQRSSEAAQPASKVQRRALSRGQIVGIGVAGTSIAASIIALAILAAAPSDLHRVAPRDFARPSQGLATAPVPPPPPPPSASASPEPPPPPPPPPTIMKPAQRDPGLLPPSP